MRIIVTISISIGIISIISISISLPDQAAGLRVRQLRRHLTFCLLFAFSVYMFCNYLRLCYSIIIFVCQLRRHPEQQPATLTCNT